MNVKTTKTIPSVLTVLMANQGQPTTSKTSSSHTTPTASENGFTLIEILIVLAIIAMVMSMGLPAIQRVTYQRLNSTTRKFVGLVRTVRNDAVLLNKIHRLVINLDKNSWEVEAQKGFKMLGADPEETDQKKLQEKAAEGESNFAPAEKFSKEEVPLPAGVVFNGVLTEREGKKNAGIVHIHFFPNGYNDQAILYLNKDGAKSGGYSLVVRPTGGHVDILPDHVENFD